MSLALDIALHDAQGVLRYQRRLSAAISRAKRAGRIVRVLPRVYAVAEAAGELATRVAALFLNDPDAVIVGRAAAALTFWPELKVDVIEVARAGDHPPAPGFRWRRRRVDPAHIVTLESGARVTNVAVTVLDLLTDLGGNAIDQMLRKGSARLGDLWTVLSELPHRRGNPLRRTLLYDSRDEPWSEAERAFHCLLRRAAVPAFRTNAALGVGGSRYIPDVRIDALRLIFEVDGYEEHSKRVRFSGDRQRDIDLALAGWVTHRFAAVTIEDEPETVVRQVKALVGQRAAELGIVWPP